MMPRDLFLSHASDDAEIARELRNELEAAGYTCWMAPDDIVGTETWTEQILAAIEATRAMIVLVSAPANRSTHVSREVNLALGKRRAVLPIRIEAVAPQGSLEYLLSLVQRVDAFPPPISAHRDRILRRVEATLRSGAPTESPAPGGPATPAPEEPPTSGERPGTSPADPPGPGAVVAGFTIEAAIGEGGMATVYRARQAEPRRAVALKVIRADHAGSESYRRRFLEEKDTLAALEHPGIVPIYAAGESGGHLYLAMRLVDGADLQARIARDGRLSLGETVRILHPIADAIDYAHASGIVHRDLKPSNILLDRDGRPYLTDFGLGKRMEGGADLSDPGIAIGTLGYMAPEQLVAGEGNPLTPAIDIYALGCIVYMCLTGEPAFPGTTPEQVMYAKVNEPPPRVLVKRPELPPAVDAIVGRALARQPADRFPSAREMLRDLEAVLVASTGQKTAPVPRGPSSTRDRAVAWVRNNTAAAVIASAMTLVGVVTIGAVLAGLGDEPGPSPSPAATATPTTAPTATPAPTPTQPPATPTAPVVGAYPNTEEQALVALLPAAFATVASCDRYADAGWTTPVAMIQCPAPGTPAVAHSVVFYARYADVNAMNAQYQRLVEAANAIAGNWCGREELPATDDWQYTATETLPAAAGGRLGCYQRTTQGASGVQFVWTHERARTLVLWFAPDRTTGFTFWEEWARAVGR